MNAPTSTKVLLFPVLSRDLPRDTDVSQMLHSIGIPHEVWFPGDLDFRLDFVTGFSGSIQYNRMSLSKQFGGALKAHVCALLGIAFEVPAGSNWGGELVCEPWGIDELAVVAGTRGLPRLVPVGNSGMIMATSTAASLVASSSSHGRGLWQSVLRKKEEVRIDNGRYTTVTVGELKGAVL